ncbi:MAG: TolC family protein [Bacteroidetes bacterium]|nr:MAG: TolC family protein [Bacteroidota bacterium]
MKENEVSKQSAVNNRQVILSIVYCLLSTLGFAQILSLDTILSRIEKNNSSILSYQNKILSANEMAKGVKSWMPPTLSLQFDSATIGISQMLPNPRKQNAKVDYLKSLATLESNDASYLKNQFFTSAKIAYYERYVSEKKSIVLKENLHLLKLMLEISELQIAYNKSNLQSVYRAQAKLYSQESMLKEEQGMIQEATSVLNYLMNENLENVFAIDSVMLLKKYTMQPPDTSKETLESKRSDIQKMNNSITSMQLNKKVIMAQSNPDFGVMVERNNTYTNRHPFMLELTMTIPILPWVSKMYKSESRAMDFQINAMEQEKAGMINMASQMAKMNLIKLHSAYQIVDNYTDKIIPAYAKNFEVNLLAYRQNTGDLLKVLMAWDDLQMAKMEYLDFLETTLKTEAELEKVLENK